MSRLAIVTATHFSNSPRVWREADSLAARGHHVTVVGTWIDAGHAELDRLLLDQRPWSFRCAADLRRWNGPKAIVERARRRFGRELLELGVPNPYFLGYAVPSLLRAATAVAAELTILHLPSPLWVGKKLLSRGYPIGVDIEDWHSENFAPGEFSAREARYLEALERTVLRGALHATTTSQVLAEALSEAYGTAPPAVIYNGDPAEGDPLPAPRPKADALRLLWFSQTLGAHRGLEDLCDALKQLPTDDWRVDLLAASNEASRRWLYRQLPEGLHARVRVLPLVPPEKLPRLVADYDVGLSLQRNVPRNRDLSVTNKILRYLQSGLYVLASDALGNREVLSKMPEGGRSYPSGSPSALAKLLEEVISVSARLEQSRRPRAETARSLFAREAQADRLVASIDEALARARTPAPGSRTSSKVELEESR